MVDQTLMFGIVLENQNNQRAGVMSSSAPYDRSLAVLAPSDASLFPRGLALAQNENAMSIKCADAWTVTKIDAHPVPA